jgi:hypothetical protein
MLGLAKSKCARFLLASTSEMCGDPQVSPQPETYSRNVNPIGPRGVYDQAKRYAEAMTMAYDRQQGVDTCIARIVGTYVGWEPEISLEDGLCRLAASASSRDGAARGAGSWLGRAGTPAETADAGQPLQ